MALYETHIKIVLYFKKLCYKKSGTQTRKADLETSRLFYEQFWNVLPIILTKNYASQLE